MQYLPLDLKGPANLSHFHPGDWLGKWSQLLFDNLPPPNTICFPSPGWNAGPIHLELGGGITSVSMTPHPTPMSIPFH